MDVYLIVEFIWDENKRKSNLVDHGIDFKDLKIAFQNPLIARLDLRFEYGEERWIAYGIFYSVVVVMVYIKSGSKIRLISARRATKNEQKRYYEKLYE